MQGVGQNPAIEMSRDPNCPKVELKIDFTYIDSSIHACGVYYI